MKKKGLALILLLFIVFNFTGCGRQLTEEQKISDFKYMYEVLKENYPYFEVNKRVNGVDWLSKENKYLSQIKKTKDDEDFFNAMNNILSELHNGHTAMLDKNTYDHMKDIYKKNSNKNEAWLKQLESPKADQRYKKTHFSINPTGKKKPKNNVETKIIERDKAAYLSVHSFDYNYMDKDMKVITPFLRSVKNYDKLIIDIRGNGGGAVPYWEKGIAAEICSSTASSREVVVFRGGKFAEPFIKEKLGKAYNDVRTVSTLKFEGFQNVPPEVNSDFKTYFEDYELVMPNFKNEFKGKIFLLVDRNVFSAAESFAVFAKNSHFATLVGERTGGDGIGMDPVVCTLPNSGYIFRFPVNMGLNSDGSCNFEKKTEPDIKVPAKVDSDMSKDAAIQAVLKVR